MKIPGISFLTIFDIDIQRDQRSARQQIGDFLPHSITQSKGDFDKFFRLIFSQIQKQK